MNPKPVNWIENAAGRRVPDRVNGEPVVPFQGVGKYKPQGRTAGRPIRVCQDYPGDGDKRAPDLKTALQRCGLKDGMTISTHHHFRDGDLIANQVFDICADLGLRDLRWFPSAAFPCHAPLIRHLDSGVIHHIEGSMNGPLGDYCSRGHMNGAAVLRSHGGRWQALQDGEVHIDVAVLAAPCADAFGNCNGSDGPSACGPLGYAEADAQFADHVIVVTDHPVPFPCTPWQIPGQLVDYVVVTDRIGIPEKILSGTTQLTKSPDRLRTAELIVRFAEAAGLIRDGFSFQTGAGGTSLAVAHDLSAMMKEKQITASFYLGGSHALPVQMMQEGLIRAIIDIQAFDLEAVRSARDNRNHISCGPFITYNDHGKGNLNSLTDIAVLGATEVDVEFNANVVTHSDGRLMHGIGGWQNCVHAKTTVLAVPSFRDRMPVIVDRVTTLSGPGELIDVVATERGLCINPRRTDLLQAVKGSGLPVIDIHDLHRTVLEICGGPPDPPKLTDQLIAVVKWVDGTVLDSVFGISRKV
ncbi:MAG: citrate lyase subunit alpha [candidate division KSB1 bacterium]|nr:citrate lyase subunit alpha [candidate division KSB1 bacterium]